jgi:predicted Zn-dependent protease
LRVGLLDGGDAVLTEAKRLLAGNSEGYAIDEDDVNMVGCILFMTGHAQASLPLLRWNTERFPKSANTWDSLAWVYRELGDRARAIENFKIDVRLDPKNVVAAHALADLTGPP